MKTQKCVIRNSNSGDIIMLIFLQILRNTCCAIKYISFEASCDGINMFWKFGTVEKLLDLMKHSNDDVKIPAIKAIGHLSGGHCLQKEMLMEKGICSILVDLLRDEAFQTRLEACSTLSKLITGTCTSVQGCAQVQLGLCESIKFVSDQCMKKFDSTLL